MVWSGMVAWTMPWPFIAVGDSSGLFSRLGSLLRYHKSVVTLLNSCGVLEGRPSWILR